MHGIVFWNCTVGRTRLGLVIVILTSTLLSAARLPLLMVRFRTCSGCASWSATSVLCGHEPNGVLDEGSLPELSNEIVVAT